MAEINTQTPVLDAETLRKMDRYWSACNYLAAGMIYLRDNPLLREPLKPEHIKRRLLGHWGSDPGQSFHRRSRPWRAGDPGEQLP
jgi:xylulose-5-phosphate/fructose-6-phosphate phosphoketolase